MMDKKEYAEKLSGQDIPMQNPIVVIDYTVFRFWYGWTAQRSYQSKYQADISQMCFPLESQAREQIEKWREADNKNENMPDYA